MPSLQEHAKPISTHAAGAPSRTLKFTGSADFRNVLQERVDAYFKRTGLPERDCPQMYLKTAVLMSAFIVNYCVLVFVAQVWWQVVPLAMAQGLLTSFIGFNVQHDGGHLGYSDRPWLNKLMGVHLDLIGGASYVWRWKHGVFHHTYSNVTGYDSDLDIGGLARVTPHQKHHAAHRWQHIYVWFLYGVMIVKWHFFDDFRDVIVGRVASSKFPRPKGWDLFTFVAGKIAFFSVAFGIPMLVHPPLLVLGVYGISALVIGLSLSTVFQLAHCVERAEFPMPDATTGKMENSWAIHQVQTTVDFARDNRLVSWLVGGLNFQIEHHLFPRICHINYPALSPIVEATCKEFGIAFNENKTFSAGVASHYRWMREMGRA